MNQQSNYSLKNRLIFILLLTSVIPIFLIGTTSYYYINSLQENKVRNGIQNNLAKVKASIENSLDNLNHISQQLALGGKVGIDIYEYMTTDNMLDKKRAGDSVDDEINFIGSTNPNVSLMMYYNVQSNQYIFQNLPIRTYTSIYDLPVLSEMKGITYYAPHRTLSRVDDRMVLAVTRKVNVYDIGDNYIYIETNSTFLEDVFKDFGMKAEYLLVSDQGQIIYSENSATFPVGSLYSSQKKTGAYYAFEEKSGSGWTVVSLIPNEVIEKETRSWFVQVMFFSFFSLGVSLLFVWIIWRTVYRPLTRISKVIFSLDSEHPAETKLTRLIEFDRIIHQFHYMRSKISDLMVDIRHNEKKKAKLEVDKLLLQINPHFIHNTLDTIRWIARINGQDEIDRLTSTLNRLLYYNMGKGKTSTISDELEALRDYVELQGIRYNFRFNVHVDADENVLQVHLPRFILQPIVENALYHGGSDDGVIQVRVGWHNETKVEIKVIDNGAGIADESIRELLQTSGERRESGMGIGIQYVKRIIEYQYGEEAQMLIESGEVGGTSIRLILPISRKEEEAHESADR